MMGAYGATAASVVALTLFAKYCLKKIQKRNDDNFKRADLIWWRATAVYEADNLYKKKY